MTIVEAAPGREEFDEAIGFQDRWVDSPYGMIEPENEFQHRIAEVVRPLFDAINTVPSGSEAMIDNHTYVLLNHSLPNKQVVSLATTERRGRVGDIRTFSNHAYSLMLNDDGILRGEDHMYRDIIRPGSPIQRVPHPETVSALTDEKLSLFARFLEALPKN